MLSRPFSIVPQSLVSFPDTFGIKDSRPKGRYLFIYVERDIGGGAANVPFDIRKGGPTGPQAGGRGFKKQQPERYLTLNSSFGRNHSRAAFVGNTFQIAHALGSIQNHEMSSSRRIRRRDVVVGTDRQLYLSPIPTSTCSPAPTIHGLGGPIRCIVGASGERMWGGGPLWSPVRCFVAARIL